MSRNKVLPELFRSLPWCKPNWYLSSMNKETNELIRQCSDIPDIDPSEDVEEVINKSVSFPIPFPVESVRLHTLKEMRPLERLQRNISSTYPLIHEKVLFLMTHFLVYKREFGSSIEKCLYKDMTVPELIDRLLTKRAVSFVGRNDIYLLRSGEEGKDGWESIGTPQQRSPLLLEDYLSYDEIKLSSFLYTCGWTECINDGDRYNAGKPGDNIEQEAVAIGTVGPRFARPGRMECEDVILSSAYTTAARGYGEAEPLTSCLHVLRNTYGRDQPKDLHMWRHIWADFYQVPSFSYDEVSPKVGPHTTDAQLNYRERYIRLKDESIFDNEVYYKRIAIIAECTLSEAESRAQERGIDAYVNIIGCGLGVWKKSQHQNDVYVLTFLERTLSFLKEGQINHIADVNFAFIDTTANIKELFDTPMQAQSSDSEVKTLFLEHEGHPRGGIRVWMESRKPSSKLREDRVLVLTLASDPNSLPGNEFWFGSLTTSGDPATACSTQVSELHNAHLNKSLCALKTRVHTQQGLKTLRDYEPT